MNWLNIKDVLPPETIREILNKRVIHDIKYYPKPRDESSCTAIVIEVTKRKEIVPTAIEVLEFLPYKNSVNRILIEEKPIRYRDRKLLTREELNKLNVVFQLLGLNVI